MAKKMTENERRLMKIIGRLRKENENLKDEISSLQIDLFLTKDELRLALAKDEDDDDSKYEDLDLSVLEADDFAMYSLEEIGFDTTYETVSSLLNIARVHCEAYEDRQEYLPIDTVSKAIKYLTENGFRVTEI